MRKVFFILGTAFAVIACNSTNSVTENPTNATVATTPQGNIMPAPESETINQLPPPETATSRNVKKSTNTIGFRKKLAALMASMAKPAKFFTVSSTALSTLKGSSGMEILFDPTKLENEDGTPVKGPIKVELKEAFTKLDCILNNAPTVSDGKPLVSEGSFYLNATNNGKKMRIKNGEGIDVKLPKIKDNKMQLFYGEQTETGTVNWKVSDDKIEDSVEKLSTSTSPKNTAITTTTTSAATLAQYNCFNLTQGKYMYTVLSVGNTIMITKALDNKRVTYIEDARVPAKTLCIRDFNPKVYRTFKADTTNEDGFVVYEAVVPAKTNEVDMEYLEVLRTVDIKVPVNAIVTSVVSEASLKPKPVAKKADTDFALFSGEVVSTGGTTKLNTEYNKANNALYSTIKLAKMGWVNCDKFIKEPNPAYLLVENDDRYPVISTSLVLNDMYSAMSTNYFDKKTSLMGFGGMPANKQATLIAYTTKDDKLYAQVMPVNTSDGTVKLDLKPMANADFKKVLEASIR